MKIAKSAKHTLGAAALRERIDQRVAFYTQKYPKYDLGAHYRWLDDRRARAEYRGGSANVTVGEDEVTIVIDVPFFAMVYRGRITEFMQREIDVVTHLENDPAQTQNHW